MELNKKDESIEENKALLKVLFDNMDGGICVYNTDKVVIAFNERFAEMYFGHYRKMPVIGATLANLFDDEDIPRRQAELNEVLQNKKITYESSYFSRGKELFFKKSLSPLLVNEQVTGVVVHTTDVSEVYKKEHRLEKLNHELSLLSRINDAMIQIKDAQVLMESVCTLLTTQGAYAMAWITFKPQGHNPGNIILPAAYSGPAGELNYNYTTDPTGGLRTQGPVAQCMRTGQMATETHINLSDLDNSDIKQRIAATIALPLLLQDGQIAVLAVSSYNESAFGIDERNTLKRIAENLAFALRAIHAIEERDAANKQLKDSLKELSIYKAALDRSFIVDIADIKGTLTYVNDNLCNILQYNREELIGKSYSLLTGDITGASYYKELLDTLGKGDIWRGDIEIVAKNGAKYWVDTTVIPFKNEEDTIWQLVAIRIDITQKRIDEEALAKSKANLSTIFDNTAIGYVLVNEHLNIISFNQAAAAFATNELHHIPHVGDFMPAYFTPARRAYLEAATFEVLTGKIQVFELSYQHPDDELHWYNIRLLPVTNSNNITTGIIVEIRNVTQRMKEQQEREKITTDLIYRNNALEQFTYIVSHNLRSPVASIIGLTNLLTEMELGAEEQKAAIEGLGKLSGRLDEVIKDINEILSIKNKVNDYEEIISFSAITHDVEEYILQHYVPVQFTINTDFISIDKYRSVRNYIYSIFYNLISNSIKYSKKDVMPVINIKSSVDEDEGVVNLFFGDNGIGMDLKKSNSEIFGIYKRFHLHIEGKGLGLFMVKTQVEMLGGSIDVVSEVDKGTEFIIKLPLNT